MLNLEHQCPSSVRRDENATDISVHIRKEAQLRLQLEQERNAKMELQERLTAEQKVIKVKTKQVLDMMKQKLGSVQSELSATQAELSHANQKRSVVVDLLRAHCGKLATWSSEVHQVDSMDHLSQLLLDKPMQFMSRNGGTGDVQVSNLADISNLILAELDTIISMLEDSSRDVSEFTTIKFVTAVLSTEKQVSVSVRVQEQSARKSFASPSRRKPLRELDLNASVSFGSAIIEGKGRTSMVVPRSRSAMHSRPTNSEPRSQLKQTDSAHFSVYEDDSADPICERESMVFELRTKLTHAKREVEESRSRRADLETALAAETGATTALRQSVQKLEGKVHKLKSSLDKSRAETAQAREALQREKDAQFNWQLRLTTEKEAVAESAARALQEQQEELQRLRDVVATPNATVLSLEAQLVRVEAEAQQLRATVSEGVAARMAVQTQLAAAQEQAKSDLASLEEMHTLQVSHAKAELSVLQQQLDAAASESAEHRGTAEVLQGRVDVLQMRLTETQRSHADLSASAAASKVEIERLRVAASAQREQVQELESLLDSQRVAASSNTDTLTEELLTKAAALDRVNEELQKMIASLESEQTKSAELASRLCQAERQRDELKEELSQVRAVQEASGVTVGQLRADIENLQSALSAVEKSSSAQALSHAAALQDLQKMIAENAADVSGLSAQLLESQQLAARLQESIAQEKARCSELVVQAATAAQENQVLVATASQLEECVSGLNSSLAAQAADYESKVSCIRNSLSQTEATLCAESIIREQLQVQHSALQASLDTTQSELASALQSLAACQEQVAAMIVHAAGAASERDDLLQKVQSCERSAAQKLADAEAEIARLTAEACAAMEASNARCASLAQQLMELSAEAEAKAQTAESERSEQEAQLEFWSEKWVATDRRLQEAQSDLIEAVQTSESASVELLALRGSCNEIQMVTEDRESALAASVFRVAGLHTQLLQLRAALTESVSRVAVAELSLANQMRSEGDLEKLVAYLATTLTALKEQLQQQKQAQEIELEETCLAWQAVRHQERTKAAVQIALVTEQLSMAHASIAEKEAKGDALLTVMEACRDRISALETQLGATKVDAQQRVDELNAERESAMAAAALAQVSVNDLRAELLSRTEEAGKLSDSLSAKAEEVSQLQLMLEEARASFQTALTDAEDRCAVLENEVRHASDALASAAASHSKAEEGLRHQVRTLGEQLSVLSLERDGLLLDVQREQEQAKASAVKKESAITLLNTELVALRDQLKSVSLAVEHDRAELQSSAARTQQRLEEALKAKGVDLLAATQLSQTLQQKAAQVEAQAVECRSVQERTIAQLQVELSSLSCDYISLEEGLREAIAALERGKVCAAVERQVLLEALADLAHEVEGERKADTAALFAARMDTCVMQEASKQLQARLVDTEAQRDAYMSEIARLQEQLVRASLESEAASLEAEEALEAARAQIQEFQASLEEQAVAEEAVRKRLQLLTAEEELLRDRVASLTMEVNDTRAEADDLKASLALTSQALQDMQVSLADLQASAEATEARLTTELQQEVLRTAVTQDALAAALQERDDLKRAVADLTAENTSSMGTLQSELDAMTATLSEKEAEVLRMNRELVSMQEAHAERVSEEADQRVSDRRALEQLIEQAKGELSLVQAETRSSMAEAETRWAAALTERVGELQADHAATVSALDYQLQSHLEAVAILTAELGGAADRKAALKGALTATERALSVKELEVASLRMEVAQRESNLFEERQEALAAAGAASAEVERLRDMAQVAEARAADQQASLAQMTLQLEASESVILGLRNSSEELQALLSTERDQTASLRAELQRLERERGAQVLVIAGLKDRATSEEARLLQLSEVLAQRELEISDLRIQIAGQDAHKLELGAELEGITLRLREAESAHACLTESVAELDATRMQLQEQCVGLETALASATERVSVLEGELEDLAAVRGTEQAVHLTELKDKQFALEKLQERLLSEQSAAAATIRDLESALHVMTAARESDSITYVAELDHRAAEIARLEASLEQRQAAILTLELQSASHAERESQWGSERVVLLAEAERRAENVASSEARIRQLEETGSRAEKAFNAESLRLSSELSEATAALVQIQGSLKAKEQELLAAEEANRALRESSSASVCAVTSECESLRTKLAALKKEYDAACGDLFQRSADLEQMQADTEALRAKAEQQQRQQQQERADAMVNWTAREAALTAEAERLLDQLTIHSADAECLRSQLLESSARAEALSVEAALLTSNAEAAREESSAKESQLMTALEASTQRCGCLESELASLTVHAEAQVAEVSRLSVALQTESNQLSQSHQLVTELRYAMEKADAERAQANALHEERVAALLHDVDASTGALQAARVEQQLLETRYVALEAAVAAAQKAQQGITLEFDQVKQELERVQENLVLERAQEAVLKTDLATATALAGRHAAEVTDLSAQLQTAHGEVRQLHERVAQLIAANQKTAHDLNSECVILREQIAQQAAQMSELAAEHQAALLDKQKELQTTSAKINDLQTLLAESASKVGTRTAEVASLSAELQRVSSELQLSLSREESLVSSGESAAADFTQRVEVLEQQLVQANAALKTAVEERDTSRAACAATSAARAAAEEALLQSYCEIATAKVALEASLQQLDASTTLCTSLQTQVSAAEAQMEASSTHVSVLTAQLEQMFADLAQARDRCAELVASSEAEKASFRDRQEVLAEEIAMLTAAVQAAVAARSVSDREHAEAVGELEAEVGQLKEAEKQLVTAIFDLEEAAALRTTELKDRTAEAAGRMQELAQLVSDNQQLVLQVSGLQEGLAEKQETCARLAVELESASSAALASEQALKGDLEKLRTTLSAKEHDYQAQQLTATAIADANAEKIATLTEELLEASAEVTRQQEAHAAEVAALQVKYDDLCLVAYQHHQAADARQEELRALQEDHAAALMSWEAQMQSEEDSCQALTAELASLRAESARADEEAHALADKQTEELAALSALVTELEEQSQTLSARLRAAEESITQREKALTAQVTKCDQATAELARAQLSLQESNAALVHLRADLQEKATLVDALERTRQALTKDLQDFAAQGKEWEQERQAQASQIRTLEYSAEEFVTKTAQLDHAIASLREVSELQSAHYSAERESHLREVQHLKDAVRERERVAQELNVRLLSVIEASDDNRRKAHDAEIAYKKVFEAKGRVVAELEKLQEEHAVVVAQDHLRAKEITDLRERLHSAEAVAAEMRQQLATRSAWSAELSTHVQQSQEVVMRLSAELAAKETQLQRSNASLAALTAELRTHEETNLKLDIQAQGLGRALQELRVRLADQEKCTEELRRSMETERASLLEQIRENEFVILELNSTLEEECSAVVELEARLEESKRSISMQDISGDGANDVLLARTQILEDHISDLEEQLQRRSGELEHLQSEVRDKDETLHSLQRQLGQLQQCSSPEATRTEFARREQELREALKGHYELQIKSLLEKLSTAEQLLVTTQQELQQLHEGQPELQHAVVGGEDAHDTVAELNAEEVRTLRQSLFRLQTKVASKSKQILLLNQQMLRDRQNFQKLKRSLVKLDGLKSLVFANNANPGVAPPLPVHQVSELFHLGMEEGEKKLHLQHDAELSAQREEMATIQDQLQATLASIRATEPGANAAREAPLVATLNRRVTALHQELLDKEEAQRALTRRLEEARLQRSEAEAGHYLSLSKCKVECAGLRKAIEDLQYRAQAVAAVSAGDLESGDGDAADVQRQLAAARAELQVQRRVQEEQESKFGRAVRTLKALEARSEALKEQCAAAHAEVAALHTLLNARNAVQTSSG